MKENCYQLFVKKLWIYVVLQLQMDRASDDNMSIAIVALLDYTKTKL